MKIKTILATALAAVVTLASCSNEDSSNVNTGEATQFLVKIEVPTTTDTRAVGDPSGTAALTLTNGKILFSTAGTVKKVITIVASGATADQVNLSEVTGSGAIIEDVDGKTDDVTFIGDHTNNLAITVGTTTITSVKANAFTVTNIAAGATPVVNVPIYGSASGTDLSIIDLSGKATLSATISVKAIGSRLQIGMIKGDATVKSFSIAGIWVNNFFTSMPYSGALTATDIQNLGSDESKYIETYVDSNSDNVAVLSDVTSLTGAFASDVKTWLPSSTTGKYWAYNVFPNVGLNLTGDNAKATLPHIIIKLTNLFAANDDDHGTKYLTVGGYKIGGTSVENIEGGNSYTFDTTDGLTFSIDDVTDKPEMKTIQAQIQISAIPWTDNVVTPEF